MKTLLKVVISFVVTILIVKVSFAQNSILLKGKGTDYVSLKSNKKGNFKYIDSSHISKYNNEAIKGVKKFLLTKVNTTLQNFEDDSIDLSKTYNSIIGNTSISTVFVSDLRLLKQYLTADTLLSSHPLLIPIDIKLDSFLRHTPTARLKFDTLQNGYIEIKLVTLDLQKAAIDFLYRQTFKIFGLDTCYMTMDYIKGWRELEAINKYLGKLKVQNLTALQNSPNLCCEIDPLRAQCIQDSIEYVIKNNSAVQFLRKYQQFILCWSWYNNGALHINPLGYIDDDHIFSSKEFNSSLDSTKKAQIDSIYGKNNQKILGVNEKITNILLLPNINSNFDKATQTFYIHFDAAKGFSQIPKKTPSNLLEDNKLVFLVHNVKTSDSLHLKEDSSKDSPDISPVADNLSVPLADLSKQMGTLNQLTSINSISNLLNDLPISSVPNFKITPPGKSDLKYTQQYKFVGPRSNTPLDSILGYTSEMFFNDKNVNFGNPEEESYVYKYNATRGTVFLSWKVNHDKAKILYYSISFDDNNICKGGCDTSLIPLIRSFIREDFCYGLDYRQDCFLSSVASLNKRFKDFCSQVEKCIVSFKKSYEILTATQKNILRILSIYNRSLPAPLPKMQIDGSPEYFTRIYNANMPVAGKEYDYSFSKNTHTIANSNEHIDSLIYKGKIGIGKRHYIVVSAGIAYTTNNYLVTQKIGNTLPTTTPGDKIHFTAGMNIHPFGLFQRDTRWNPRSEWKGRTSFYLGMSIPEPLKNLYFGLGYDIIPGLIIHSGVHLYQNDRYQIQNGQVISQAKGFSYGGIYIGLNLDPGTLISALGLFK